MQNEINVFNDQISQYTFKVIQIDEKGTVNEKLTFIHTLSKNNEVHFYFNQTFSQMIELIIIKNKVAKPTYNLYKMDSPI